MLGMPANHNFVNDTFTLYKSLGECCVECRVGCVNHKIRKSFLVIENNFSVIKDIYKTFIKVNSTISCDGA